MKRTSFWITSAAVMGSIAVGCGGSSSSRGGALAVAASTSGSTAGATTATTAGTSSSTPTPATPPSVASVGSSVVWNDAAATLVVRGAGFVAPVQVDLVDPAGVASASRSTQVVVRSANELVATFAAGLAPGVRAVVASTPAGASSRVGAPTLRVVGNVDPDVDGGHLVGWRDVQLQGASGDRPAMRIYYPAMAAASGAPIDASRAPYPMVAYGHGFRPPLLTFGIDYRNNAFLAARVASFGYIVACPDLSTNNQLIGSGATGQANSSRDADDLVATLDDLTRRGRDRQDALFGLVDETRAAFAGHSRGGDGALMAAAREASRSPRRVRAVLAFGPPATDSRNSNAPLVFGDLSTVPLLLIGASRDAIAPVADQRAILAATRGRGVVLEVVGGCHSYYKDNDSSIWGDGTAVIPLATQHAVVRRHATAWLNQLVRGQGALASPWLASGAVAAADPRARLVDDTR
jgi:dienelactone hydrolase